jgi:hypothetical protein
MRPEFVKLMFALLIAGELLLFICIIVLFRMETIKQRSKEIKDIIKNFVKKGD